MPSREPGWLEGTLDGKRGLVPANYVEYLSNDTSIYANIGGEIQDVINTTSAKMGGIEPTPAVCKQDVSRHTLWNKIDLQSPIFIDREAREIMYLVASVRPSVRPSVRRSPLSRLKKSHYQPRVFVCVSSNRADAVDRLLMSHADRRTDRQTESYDSL